MARRRLANLWAVALCLAGNAWGADSAAGPAGSGAQFFASSDGASVAAPSAPDATAPASSVPTAPDATAPASSVPTATAQPAPTVTGTQEPSAAQSATPVASPAAANPTPAPATSAATPDAVSPAA